MSPSTCPTCTILRGLPASGKTTLATEICKNEDNTKRVCRDDIRKMIRSYEYPKDEKYVLQIEKNIVKTFLLHKQNVVIDDTNLKEDVVESWKILAIESNATYKVKWTHDINSFFAIRECIERDKDREKPVGAGVILNMALKNKIIHRILTGKFIICDIDGTITDPTHRLKYVSGKEKNWEKFFAQCANDSPRENIIENIISYAEDNDCSIIYCSGRPEKLREDTTKWICKHIKKEFWPMENQSSFMREGWPMRHQNMLIMRPNKNYLKDYYLKEYFLTKLFDGLNIVKVWDDRPSVIRMWKENNLEVIDVGDGVEF